MIARPTKGRGTERNDKNDDDKTSLFFIILNRYYTYGYFITFRALFGVATAVSIKSKDFFSDFGLYDYQASRQALFRRFFFFSLPRKYQLIKNIIARPAAVIMILTVMVSSFFFTSPFHQILSRRSLRELETTVTELKAIAREAIIGLRVIWKKG